jgi:hypothetical protein
MSSPSFLDVETTNADELAEAISEGFGYRVAPSSDLVSHRQHVIVGDPVTIADLEWDTELRLAVDATDEVMFVEVHSGTFAFNPWGCEQALGRGDAFVIPPDQELEFAIDHAVASTCSFSAQLLRRVAQEVWDDEDVCLAEGSVRPVDAACHWLWRRTVQEYRQQVLETPDVYGNELLRAEASRFVVVSAISAFGLVAEPRREACESAAVRRATTWVDEHRREPITVHDVAAAARLSPRPRPGGPRARGPHDSRRGGCRWPSVGNAVRRRWSTSGWRGSTARGQRCSRATRRAVTPSRPSQPTGASATPDASRRCTGRPTARRPARR